MTGSLNILPPVSLINNMNKNRNLTFNIDKSCLFGKF